MGAFARRGRSALVAAGIGGAAPDLPAIALELRALWFGGHTPTEIYRDLYFSPAWQAVLAPGHSFLVWGVVLAAALWARRPSIQAGATAGLLHLACDLPLHAAAPHRHFWPASDWRFASPVSSWHPEHFGQLIQPLELAMVVALGLWVYRQVPRPGVLASVAGLWLAFGTQAGIYLALP